MKMTVEFYLVCCEFELWKPNWKRKTEKMSDSSINSMCVIEIQAKCDELL